MGFVAPYFLWIGAGISAMVVALHLIVTRQPKAEVFPTARFVPESPVQAVSRATRPTDLLLLLLRALSIMSVAAAFARPVITPDRESVARVILADISRSSASLEEVHDSAAKYFRRTDVLIGYDSVPRVITQPDSLLRETSRGHTGSLSPALVAAIRSAASLRERADSISLVIVSAFPATSWNAATDTIRSLWPGAVTIVRVKAKPDAVVSTPLPVSHDFSAEDPLRFGVSLASSLPRAQKVRIVRGDAVLPTSADSGEVLLHWPIETRPMFSRQTGGKAHGALVVGQTVLVAPFKTNWEFPPDSLRGATVLARWADGEIAAIQRNTGSGCIRSANVPVAAKGDLVIRPEFVAVVQKLMSACDNRERSASLSGAALLRLKGGSAAAPRAAFPASSTQQSPLSLWFLLATIVLLFGEQFARRASGRAFDGRLQSDARRAA